MPDYLRAFRAAEIPESGAIPFVASTEGTKRDGIDVDSSGWELANYSRNPVVLISHDYFSLPVGRADVRVDGKDLLADITFDMADPRGQEADRKYRTNFLSAISVGFNIMEWAEEGSRRTKSQELLDISVVAVPGDPEALKRMQQRGITNDLQDLLFRLSDPNPTPIAATSEFVWPGAALAMARLFLDTNDDDEARESAYRRISKQYRTLGHEPPEWMTRSELSLLDEGRIRALFGAGEAELLGWEPEQRAGAVLSARNYGDLEQAATLVRGVLERAVKETEISEEDAERAYLERFMPLTGEPAVDFLRQLAG